jgi:ATP-dependent Clp protease protease subunit
MKKDGACSRRARARATRIQAAADGEAEVLMYDEIGFWGIQAKPFIQELQALDAETIHLRINSPGGSVFDGIAIANALRQLDATVITHVDALAASIASVIALAGDEVRMADNAFLMIHEAWTISIGNATQLRTDADLLDKIGGSIIDAYVKKTGASRGGHRLDEGGDLVHRAEALDEGFIDAIDGQSDAQASFDLSVFSHAPAALAGREASAPGARELERALRDAGCSRAEAKAILAGGLKPAAAVPQRTMRPRSSPLPVSRCSPHSSL